MAEWVGIHESRSEVKPLLTLRRLNRACVIELSQSGEHFMRIQKAGILLFSLGLFSWLGCGGDNLCDKADHASQNLANAIAGCSSLSSGGPVAITPYSKATCENALSHCSGSDRETLSNAFDCLAKVNRCVPGQEFQFLGSVLDCLRSTANISQACQMAYGT